MVHQPLVEELENMLSNQEALAKQTARSSEPNSVLLSKGKFNKKNTLTKNDNNENGSSAERNVGGNSHNNNVVKCYRCGKPGHIKKNYRMKLSKANVACESEDNKQLKWEQCFTIEVVEELHQHNGKRVIVTTNNSTYPVTKGVAEISSNNIKPERAVVYGPETKKFVSSRDVVFDEVSFY
ncbi:hypothetical protein Salat_1453700 [Sesamum alatum]|uniref:CCHC-type domain-containing protein n=1 Tax=Sesamum alatum TaxID=300844 RepID=A0AAE1YAT5_9LAMI|nr:hypothetical protein Salat_1453700 [Sesamum alatum]